MAEPFVASVQYDDLKGFTAFDGYDGPPLHKLAKLTNMPAGYFPIAFALHRLYPDLDGRICFDIIAVRDDGKGRMIDTLVATARETEEPIIAHQFSGVMPARDFQRFFKRTRIIATNRELVEAGVEIKVDHDDSPGYRDQRIELRDY